MITQHQCVKLLHSCCCCCCFLTWCLCVCALTGSIPAGHVRLLEVCEERNTKKCSGGSQSQEQSFLKGNAPDVGAGLVELEVWLSSLGCGVVDKLCSALRDTSCWCDGSYVSLGHFLS